MVLADPKLKATAPPVNDDNLLTVTSTPHSAPATGSLSATRPGLHNDLTQKLATLDMNAETKLDLRNEDLKELQELGQGNGGSVKKVEHVPTGKIMAKKVRFLAFLAFHSVLFSLRLFVAFVRCQRARDECCYRSRRVGLTLIATDKRRGRHRFSFFVPACATFANVKVLDCFDRRQTLRAEANPKRASNHARLSLRLHHLFLRRIPLRSQYLHVYRVYGQGFPRWHLQKDWTH